jgi:hypothetical protein
MSEARHTLDELQRWMQAVVTHPGGVTAGIDSAAARDQIALAPRQVERVVTRSQALTALERLEIYNRAYFARLLACLREEYSVLAAALGDELFDSFAIGYLQEHPSQSYTLSRLGEKFPEFLARTRPVTEGLKSPLPGESDPPAGGTSVTPSFPPPVAPSAADDETADWSDFMIDLARLERAINEVFDGPGPERGPLLDGTRLSAISPEQWPGARLVCVPSLRLMRFSYPVSEFFAAIRRGEKPSIPEPMPIHLAITRRDYRVRRYPLEPAQHQLLQTLLDGEPVGTAIERAAALSPLADAQLAAAIREWFHFWTAEGFFCGVVTP